MFFGPEFYKIFCPDVIQQFKRGDFCKTWTKRPPTQAVQPPFQNERLRISAKTSMFILSPHRSTCANHQSPLNRILSTLYLD